MVAPRAGASRRRGAVRLRPYPEGAPPDTELTEVTVAHRGWAAIRPDHPVRHGNQGAAMLRMIGLWWSSLLTGLREHTLE